jgi:hypothetical protein
VPTATHDDALVQVPKNNSPVGAFGVGVGTTDQPVPGVAGRAGRPLPATGWPWPETLARAGAAGAARASAAATAMPAPARAMPNCRQRALSRLCGQILASVLCLVTALIVDMRIGFSWSPVDGFIG